MGKQLPITRDERHQNLGYTTKPWEELEDKIERIRKTILASPITIPNGPRTPSFPTEISQPCDYCNNMGYVTHLVSVDHPEFGRAFPCPVCKEPELEQQRQDADKQRIQAIIAESGLSKHHMYSFDDFLALPDEYRAGKEMAAEACKTMAHEQMLAYDGICKYGLLLYGPYGTCKTTLGTSAVIEIAQKGLPVMRIKFADLLDKVQASYSATQIYLRSAQKGAIPPLTAEQIIQAAEKVDFLMVDDLGDPRLMGEISDDKRRITHRIFEYRLEYEKPTLVTTNLTSKKQIYTQFSERTGQRIVEMCHMIEVTGLNLRV